MPLVFVLLSANCFYTGNQPYSAKLFGTVLYLCLTMRCRSVIITLSLKSFKVLKRLIKKKKR